MTLFPTTIIVDHIENIVWKLETSPIMSHPFEYMPEGIHRIALWVREKENKNIKDKLAFEALSFTPDNKYIACQLHWFANSLVNYARLVALVDITDENGWTAVDLQREKSNIKTHCRKYAQEVVGNVYRWRNKVGAHFASTDPYKEDNMVTLIDSTSNPVVFQFKRYYAHAHTLKAGEQESKIQEWSLTKVFEEISPRFFPERKIPDLDGD